MIKLIDFIIIIFSLLVAFYLFGKNPKHICKSDQCKLEELVLSDQTILGQINNTDGLEVIILYTGFHEGCMLQGLYSMNYIRKYANAFSGKVNILDLSGGKEDLLFNDSINLLEMDSSNLFGGQKFMNSIYIVVRDKEVKYIHMDNIRGLDFDDLLHEYIMEKLQ